jgi:hypothetical protein
MCTIAGAFLVVTRHNKGLRTDQTVTSTKSLLLNWLSAASRG